jgi:hypothetical protein
VELNEAESGHLIWADRLDGALSDLFDLQDRIAMRVVAAVAPHVRELELNRALRKHPGSMTAYDLTLQALDLTNRMDRSSLTKARVLLEQATEHDPGYALAYSQLASLGMRWIGQGWSENEAADLRWAADAAQMAIERDRNDALALSIYGHLQSYLFRAYDVAQDYLERALAKTGHERQPVRRKARSFAAGDRRVDEAIHWLSRAGWGIRPVQGDARCASTIRASAKTGC